MATAHIEFWSDYACPFCYIGKRRLEAALALYDGEAEFSYRSYMLHPEAQRLEGVNYAKIISEKYETEEQHAQHMIDDLVAMAKDEGLDYQLNKAIHGSTLDAHRLTKYAITQGQGGAMEERLLKAYFTDGLDIGDTAVLADLAAEVGLDRAQAVAMLDRKDFEAEVWADQNEAKAKRIDSVPLFVINGNAIFGASTREMFLSALEGRFSKLGGL